MSTPLSVLEKAAVLIQKARTLEQAFQIKAVLTAAQIEARRKHSLELEKHAVEYKFMTYYRIGEILDI